MTRAFWCFISYRHADNKELGRQWATWLHQAIETYEVPADLVGTTNERGETIPARIFPVFRDEDELPADADLASPIYRALDESKYILVICSPRAVASEYVANEIRYFKQLRREDRVLAAMIYGEPNASWDAGKQAMGFHVEQECFPAPLRHRVNSEGHLLEDRTEPIAADFRLDDGTQGWTSPEAYRQALSSDGKLTAAQKSEAVEAYRKKCELMKLKIIAGLLGVALGTLTKRDAAYQLALAQKRAKTLRRWLVAVGLLAMLAVAGGGVALQQKREAVKEKDMATAARNQAEDIMNFLLYDLTDELTPMGRLDIVAKVQKKVDAYYRETGIDPSNRAQVRRRATAFTSDGEVLASKGNPAAALNCYEQSCAIMRQLVISDPTDPLSREGVALALDKIGDADKELDNMNAALSAYGESLDIMHKLLENDPTNTEWQSGVAVAQNDVGVVEQKLGKLDAAFKDCQESVEMNRKLVAINGADWQRKHELSVSLASLAAVEMAQGKLDASDKDYMEAVSIMHKAALVNPGWGRDEALLYNNIGDVQEANGNLDNAIHDHLLSASIDANLAAVDQSNMYLRFDSAISGDRAAKEEEAQGKVDDALQQYHLSLDLLRMAVQANPSNNLWQRYLGLTLECIGKIEYTQGKLDSAFVDLQESSAIIRRLTKIDPSNTTWLVDLGLILDQLGLVEEAGKKFDVTLKTYQEALEVMRRAVSAGLSDSSHQGAVCILFGKVAKMEETLGDPVSALKDYQQSLDIARRLLVAEPSNATWQGIICGLLGDIGLIRQAQGNSSGAQSAWTEARDIAQQLEARDPNNADYKSKMLWLESHIQHPSSGNE